MNSSTIYLRNKSKESYQHLLLSQSNEYFSQIINYSVNAIEELKLKDPSNLIETLLSIIQNEDTEKKQRMNELISFIKQTQHMAHIDKKKIDCDTLVEKTVEMSKECMNYPEQYVPCVVFVL